MRDQTIERWLEALASGAPAPGGGAAAGLSAAAGAALIEMVCNLTIGRPRYARHEAIMREALAQATGLRGQALGLAADDATAFGAVTAAYKLPKETGEQARARTERIQRAMLEATRVPLRTAAVAGDVIRLAGRMAEGANVTALADLAAAAVSARAAVEVVRLNVEANLMAITDPSHRKAFADRMTDLSALVGEAERIVADIRTRIQG